MFEKSLYKIACWLDKAHPPLRKKCIGCGKRKRVLASYQLWGNVIYCCKDRGCYRMFEEERENMDGIFEDAGYKDETELVFRVG